MAENIETRIQALTDAVTENDLARLRTEIAGCLAPEKLRALRTIVTDKKDINADTREKLNNLLQECPPLARSEKTPESTSSFDRVFAGARSMAFSETNREKVQEGIFGILKLDRYPKITGVYRENILLAMTDRLLKDKDFQGIFNTSMGFADIANSVTKGSYADAVADASKTEIKEEVQGLEERIGLCIVRITEPLSKLLEKEKDTPKMLAFLSNPHAIADLNGGEMPPETGTITKENLESYIESLHGQILEIDKKIFPLEEIRERGMDFLASGPAILKDIFRWMLELPFIGKMLAMFLGYKDQKEAGESIDEELRQRKSLSILREFGDITPTDGGQTKEGKYAGKISILKGKDLSKIDRKKLGNFFKCTKEEGVETGTPDFWIGVFEKGEIVKKDEKGAEVKYTLEKSIRSDDLDKDFQGVYTKLNKLHDILDEKKRKVYSDDKRVMLATTTETPLPIPTPPEVVKPLTLGEIGTLTELGKLTGEERKQIIIGDSLQREWNKILPKIIDLSVISKISKEIAGVDQFCKHNLAFVKALRKESGNPIVTLEDFWKHKDKAIIAANKLPSTTTATTSPKVLATTPVKVPEIQKDEKTLLVEEFRRADRLPFNFGTDKKLVQFEDGRLKIGQKEFALKIALVGDRGPDVSNISLIGGEVKLEYLKTSTSVSRHEIIEGIPALIDMETSTNKEITGKKGKLIITRVV